MSEPVSFLALAEEYREVEPDVAARFGRVLASQSFVMGEQTGELEAAMAELVGTSFAVACSSGSAALYLALRGLDIGRGAAVLVPAYTFIATAGAIVNAGAVPVFTDVDRATLNVSACQIEAAVATQFVARDGGYAHVATGTRLSALLAVHLFGRACATKELAATAERLGVPVIEDAAQAIGAIGDGGAAGAWGAAGCFSFYPTKNLGGAGDGGVVTTNDPAIARRLVSLRLHGAETGPLHREIGINARIGELQAAYLNAKWPRLAAWTEAREAIAREYSRRLVGVAPSVLELLQPASAPAHVHHQYAVRILGGQRERVAAALADRGVDSKVFYPVALHHQPCFREYGSEEVALPVAEAAAAEVLCLPIHPFLTDAAVTRVCDALTEALSS